MEYFEAPNGRMIPIPKGRIMAFGFSPEEIQIIEKCMPTKDHLVYDADIVTDILALNYEVLLLKADSITSEDREIIVEYYTELSDGYDESIFWIGYPKPPSHLRK